MRRVDQINPKGWRGIQRLFRGEEKGSSLALFVLAQLNHAEKAPNEANCCPLLVITFQGVNVDAFGSANDKRNQFLSSQDGPERVGQTRTGQRALRVEMTSFLRRRSKPDAAWGTPMARRKSCQPDCKTKRSSRHLDRDPPADQPITIAKCGGQALLVAVALGSFRAAGSALELDSLETVALNLMGDAPP